MHKKMIDFKIRNLLFVLFLLFSFFTAMYQYYNRNISNKEKKTIKLVKKQIVNIHSKKDMGSLYFENENLAKSKFGRYIDRWNYLRRFENMSISNFWIGRFNTHTMIGLPPSIYCIVNKDSNKAVYITDTIREREAVNNKKVADKLHFEKIGILNDVFKGTIQLKDEKQANEYAKAIITAYNQIDCIIIDKATLHPIKKSPILDVFKDVLKTDKITLANMSKGPLCTRFDSDSYVFYAYVSEKNFFADKFPANVSSWRMVINKNGEILSANRKILFYWSVLDF